MFTEAECMQKEIEPEFGQLSRRWGFRYCDWLLGPAERAAWQNILKNAQLQSKEIDKHVAACHEVRGRAEVTLKWVIERQVGYLDVAFDHLTLARVGLFQAILTSSLPQPTHDLAHTSESINGLRASGHVFFLPLGLLTASLYHFVRGKHDIARKNLTETQQIAERGPMPLFLADVHLHRARMFREKEELAKAAKLIRGLGYGRRNDELVDAEEAAKNW